MNTNELLEVANGMGFTAKISKSNRSQSNHYTVAVYIDDNYDVFLNPFNPTICDLILWLMENNFYINYLGNDGVEAVSIGEKHQIFIDGSNVKENLLSIVLQITRVEKKK